MGKERARYSHKVKQEVRERYPLCRTTEDKEALAAELGIDSVAKLYNLASRLKATGQNEAEERAGDVAHQNTRLLIRETPDEVTWSKSADKYLKAEFGRRTVEKIAFHLHRSETAVFYHSRELGLRLPVKYWNAVKVAAWLAMELDELRELSADGIDIFPLHDRNGHLNLEVVSTTSLGRWLLTGNNKKRVLQNGADEFFVLEIIETLDDLANGKTMWERCKFLSHGHVCMNQYAEASCGLFCTNSDRQLAGEDPRCSVRMLNIDDLRPLD